MTAFWSFSTNHFSQTFDHVAGAWEAIISFQEDTCWNCSGELLVERFHAHGYLEKKICPVCGGLGMISTSIDSYPFSNDWADNPTYYNFLYINQEENLFEVPAP